MFTNCVHSFLLCAFFYVSIYVTSLFFRIFPTSLFQDFFGHPRTLNIWTWTCQTCFNGPLSLIVWRCPNLFNCFSILCNMDSAPHFFSYNLISYLVPLGYSFKLSRVLHIGRLFLLFILFYGIQLLLSYNNIDL